MRRAMAAILAVAASLALGSTMAVGSPGPSTRSVAIFYYSWYGTPPRDGGWQHWDQGGGTPPAEVSSAYYPARGVYSSTDPAVVRAQMREIRRAGVDTVVVSWWGPGSVEDARLGMVLGAARRARLRVAIHVEPWLGRTPAAVASAIGALRAHGIGDFYVYDSTIDPDETWAAALATVTGVRVFANTWLPGRAKRGGFQGLYSYDILVHDGTSFRRVCRSARKLGLVCAPSVGPGFDASRATTMPSFADREGGARYDAMWRRAIGAHADIVTITSYNEWHEGTQIEPARATATYASYDGAWGATGLAAQTAYLDRTALWAARYRAGSP